MMWSYIINYWLQLLESNSYWFSESAQFLKWRNIELLAIFSTSKKAEKSKKYLLAQIKKKSVVRENYVQLWITIKKSNPLVMFSENEKLNSVFLLKHHFKDHSLALKNCFGSKVPVGTFTNHVKLIFEKVLNMTLSNLSV